MKIAQSFLLAASLLGTVCEGARFLQEHERTRVFLRYGGLRGRRIARKCANRVVQDDDGDDVIIMEANRTCFDQLKHTQDILEIEYDNEVAGLGLGDKEWIDGFHRAVEESQQYGIEMIQADQVTVGNGEIVICIVDSGLAAGHPDFQHEKLNGTDTVKFYGDPWAWTKDGSGHGTHVAGIVAAASGNGKGVVGVADGLKVHITRALGDDGRGVSLQPYS